jgi:hypothetical protein
MQAFNRKIFTAAAFKSIVMIGLMAISFTAGAAEISTDPGDYAALPAGVNLAAVYYQHAENNAFYSNGNRVPGPYKLVTDIGLARFVAYRKIGDYVIDPTLVIPFGKVQLKTQFGPLAPVSASGVGDPIIGSTIWLLNQQEQKKWFGVSVFFALPLGNYEAERGPVNLGENRWKTIFQAAYVAAVGQHFMLDVVGEYSIYGDNNNYFGMTKKQDATYGLQTHLRYLVSPSTSVGVSYFQDFGGETRLDGVAQNDRLNKNRWLFNFATFIAPNTQLMLEAGQTLNVENGPKESGRFNVRVARVF